MNITNPTEYKNRIIKYLNIINNVDFSKGNHYYYVDENFVTVERQIYIYNNNPTYASNYSCVANTGEVLIIHTSSNSFFRINFGDLSTLSFHTVSISSIKDIENIKDKDDYFNHSLSNDFIFSYEDIVQIVNSVPSSIFKDFEIRIYDY